MVRCPGCGKKLLGTVQLARHLSQSSSCRKLKSHLVRVSRSTFNRHKTQLAPQAGTATSDFEHDTMIYDLPEVIDQVMEPEASMPPPPVDNGIVTEAFPGAAQVYGRGETFMDQFDRDSHADKREDNIYYPFTSKSDWQTASWLLRSGLSMSAINEFLALESVIFKVIRCILPL
jgi:hypothetical protein